MVQRVYEQVKKAELLTDVVVATDDQRIFDHVISFGGNVVMTSDVHKSGTDRCYEALLKYQESFDYVINIQGDEPYIQPEQIDSLARILDGNIELGTMVKVINDQETLFNENSPKAILSMNQDVLYFSRQTIPFFRGVPKEEWLQKHTYYKHIGIYAYRADVLKAITTLEVSPLEQTEALEQLRWLENGYSIRAVITPFETHGIDTPEDLERVKKKFLAE